VDKAILSDTVGFISDLPTQLVAAFRATLEEVTAADVVIHVRDIANPESASQKEHVLAILTDLELIDESGVSKVPIIEVWNKWDLLPADDSVELLRAARQQGEAEEQLIVPLSALTGEGCDELIAAAGRLLTGDAKEHVLALDAADGQRIAWLHAHGDVLEDAEAGDDGKPQRRLRVRLTPREWGRYRQLGED